MPTVKDYEDFADEMSALVNKRTDWTVEETLKAIGYFMNAFFMAQWADVAARAEEVRSWATWLVFANDRASISADEGSTDRPPTIN